MPLVNFQLNGRPTQVAAEPHTLLVDLLYPLMDPRIREKRA